MGAGGVQAGPSVVGGARIQHQAEPTNFGFVLPSYSLAKEDILEHFSSCTKGEHQLLYRCKANATTLFDTGFAIPNAEETTTEYPLLNTLKPTTEYTNQKGGKEHVIRMSTMGLDLYQKSQLKNSQSKEAFGHVWPCVTTITFLQHLVINYAEQA